VNQDHKVLPVSLVVPEIPGQLEHPEIQEIEVQPVLLETRVVSEQPDLPELTVKMDHEEQMEPQDQLQKQVNQDPKDHRVTMAHPVPQVIPVHEVVQETSDPLVHLDLKDKMVTLDQLESVEPLDLKEQKV